MPDAFMLPETSTSPRIAIIGGGLAGLAAAVALADQGFTIEIFEARRKLGGRAGSFLDRASGEVIDHCQHVAMGCCTNYLDFCRRTATAELLKGHRTLHFLGRDGTRSDFSPTRWLPAPLHLIGPLAGLKHLSLRDKLGIARAMWRLAGLRLCDAPDGPTVLDWLHKQRQSQAAIERFWKVVLVSALGESLDRASLAAARKVFVDGFLAHREASHIFVPQVALDELYQRVEAWLRARGTVIHLESSASPLAGNGPHLSGVRLSDGTVQAFDAVIIAVPWTRLAKLLTPEMAALVDPLGRFQDIGSAPISSLHLWFDRPLTELPHAVLVERLSQWIFARNGGSKDGARHYQVVISASHDLAGREREAVLEEVLNDLRAVFPNAAGARLLRWQLISEHQAVFSVRPGLDSIRPSQRTPIANLFLAGDWTQTGWPATMESAVRSGYLAAEAVLRDFGCPVNVLVSDLHRGWIARRFMP